MMVRYVCKSIAFLVLTVPLFSCQQEGVGPEKYSVSGNVTFDGNPLESGQITFYPVTPGLAPESVDISKGAFNLRVSAGEKRVEIIASREIPGQFTDPAFPGGEKVPAQEMYIPEKYNSKSNLQIEILPEPDQERLSFDLNSK